MLMIFSSSMTHAGIIVIWNDILEQSREDFLEWHSREHIPERVAIPGFHCGQRWFGAASSPQSLTIYATTDASVLTSAAYLERLNHPTPWTKRSVAAFRNTSRAAGTLAWQSPGGAGGHDADCANRTGHRRSAGGGGTLVRTGAGWRLAGRRCRQELRRHLARLGLATASAVIVFGLWESAARVLKIPAYLLPAPSLVFSELAQRMPRILQHAGVTTTSMLLDYGLGIAVAIPLAMALAYSRLFEGWRVCRRGRPFRLRQEHPAATGRRIDTGERRRGSLW